MIHARTLGECSLDLHGTHVGPEAEAVFGLLIYLVMERGSRIPRPMLVELMWNELPDEKGRHCLRQTMYKCRQLGVRLESTSDYVTLRADDVVADFATWLSPETLDMEQLRGGGSVGEFLPGYAPAISNAHTDWLERQRDYVHAQIRRTLTQAIATARAQGRWGDVEALARQCLRFDSLNEEATLALAEATAMSGSKAKALGIIDRYVADLGATGGDIRLPATLLRRRIAERLPSALYAAPSERCFLGRDASMALLSGLYESTRIGQGRSVFVWGEPGIGKSRLCQEFSNSVVLQGARVARVACQQSDVRRPLSAFVDIVPVLQALPGAAGASPVSVGYLRRLTEYDPGVTSPSAEAQEAEFLFGNVRRAILDLCDAVAGECTLVVHIEDVHWLDAMSWDVLRELMEWAEGAKAMVLLTARTPHATASSAAEMPVKLVRHRLAPLDGSSAATLMDAMVAERKRPMDATYRAWCVTVAEGNPLYLRELASQWLERGAVAEMPASLAGLIEARLARLQPRGLRVLQVCAVLGKNSTFARLEAATGFRRHEMLEAVEELEALGLLASDASGVSPKHDLLAAAVLRRSSGAARRLVHRHVASALEREVLETHSAELMWDCAEHWRSSGDSQRADQLTLTCGVHAEQVGLSDSAVEIYERAIRSTEIAENITQLQRALCRVLDVAGRWEHLKEVLTQLRSSACTRREGRIEHDADELLLLYAETRRGAPHAPLLIHALACLEDENATLEHRSEAAVHALRLADNAIDERSAQRAYCAARELRQHGAQPSENSLTLEVIYHSSYGALVEAVAAARQYIDFCRALDDPKRLAVALQRSWIPLLRMGQMDEARSNTSELLTIASQLAMRRLALSAIDQLCATELELHNYVAAEHWFQRAASFEDRASDPYASASLLYCGTRAALASGKTDLASQRFSGVSVTTIGESVPRARVALESVEVLLRIAQGAALPASFSDFTKRVREVFAFGGQDFSSAVVARGMSYTGNHMSAQQFLRDYQTKRREAYPIESGYVTRILPT